MDNTVCETSVRSDVSRSSCPIFIVQLVKC
ncbi:hypothetical protein RSOL_174580 [Rhizoctonia solani AG-3 Rhs1AP]|uniref:Uncharacterized protein n=1 Tax=Rhizoctonia solani AG-3 Rhs1AP TaxID=1086054 RepID=X8J530_9AGAM|nr:hypothetical protein RSOL_174580 [Rhizoctonia solani AG-3 Rhs1AP]